MITTEVNIRRVDMLLLDAIFRMEGGYVLDFSDRTFAQFFAEELDIDIDEPLYSSHGTSKAKRLRYFLQTVDKATVIRTLKALWDYREALRQHSRQTETVENAEGRFLSLLGRLEGKALDQNPRGHQPIPVTNKALLQELKSELLVLADLQPQARGYAFEKFLKRLFDAHGLSAQDPFRVLGEQIDGSFHLQGQTYLVEAKWTNSKTGAAELYVFQGKIEQKATWTRGLFISNSGFTEEGLAAIGRRKPFICMDGYDLFEALEKEIPIDKVIERKVRRAAETGQVFSRVRDLFPS